MTTQWTHDAVFEAMQSHAEPARVPLVYAYQVGEQIRTDLQNEINYLQGTVTMLGTERDQLRADLSSSVTTIELLKVSRNDALAQVAELETQIAQLNKTIFRLTHPADVYLTVDPTPFGVSQFRTGMQDVDSGLRTGNPINRTRLAAVCDVMATHVMNFGAPDLWPKGSDMKPTNWSRLDERMNMFVQMGVEPMMVMYNYPHWMKERVLKNGIVEPITEPFSTDGRVRRDCYGQLYTYCHEIALRYMAEPYNVRTFVFGNEFKGFFFRRDGKPGLDYEEYTDQYNVFVAAMLEAVYRLGIPREAVKMGGPYSAIRTVATESTETVAPGHFLHGKSYGHYRKSPLEAIEYWLQHAHRADFVAWDMGSGNAEGGEVVDTFVVQANKYKDMANWVRTLTDLPMVITEVYPKTADDGNADAMRVCAAKTVAHLSMIEAGIHMAWQWGAIGQGEYESANQNGGMLKDYTDKEPNVWYYMYAGLGSHFGEGKRLYPVTAEGEGVYTTASDTAVVMANMTGSELLVCLGEVVHSLPAYDVRVVTR